MWRYTLAFIINSLVCLYFYLVFGMKMHGREAILTTLAVAFGIATLGNELVVRILIPEEEERESLQAAIRNRRMSASLLYVRGTILGLLSAATPILLVRVFRENSLVVVSGLTLPLLGFIIGALSIHRTLRRINDNRK